MLRTYVFMCVRMFVCMYVFVYVCIYFYVLSVCPEQNNEPYTDNYSVKTDANNTSGHAYAYIF